MPSLYTLNKGVDNITFDGQSASFSSDCRVSREFGKTAHLRVNMCPPVLIGRLGVDLRIDVGAPQYAWLKASER